MKKNQITLLMVLFAALLMHTQNNFAQHWSVANVAGMGSGGDFIEGAPALENHIPEPFVIVEHDGDIYFTCPSAGVPSKAGIYRLNSDDQTLNLLHAEIETISGFQIDSEGNMYYSRGFNGTDDPEVWERIYKIDTGGSLTVLAGNGIIGTPPLEYPDATETWMGDAGALLLGPNEQYLYYIAPYLGADGVPSVNYIQRIDLLEGSTERYVGAGAGDGVTLAEDGDDRLTADLSFGTGMAFDSQGNLYFMTYDDQIKKVVDDKIYHVAGTGDAGYEGDDLPAATAKLDLNICGMYVNEADELILADKYNYRIRKIALSTTAEPDGNISLVCGSGYDEDDGFPEGDLGNGDFRVGESANIFPTGIALLGDEIYFTDRNYRVRKTFICTNPVVTAINADKDVICTGEDVTLTLTTEPGDGDIWVWYKDDCKTDEGLDVTYATTPSITVPAVEGDRYYAAGYGGCAFKPECFEYVFEINCQSYYNAITPNQDGKNDFLEIPALESHPVNQVLVYNRWGDFLYEVNNYDNDVEVWRGTKTNGDNVDSGTYFFTATSDGAVITSGWVQVITE